VTDYAEPDHRRYLDHCMGAHAAYRLHYHLVWGVKARHQVLEGAVAEVLRESLLLTAETIKVTILAMHMEPEHVHMLLSLRPDMAVATVVGRFKGASARRLREAFPSARAVDEQSLWSAGYFARTVGDITTAQAKAYLDRQRDHHLASAT
jgi:putative transposase